MDFSTLFDQLANDYKKESDQDFPINKIRFYMDLFWNVSVGSPLTSEQKDQLKSLIDLLNELDDHKLSPTRELISNLTERLTPLVTTYPSLAHTFTVIVTTLIPAYQRYLMGLETHVKDARSFSKEDVLLYYDMTLVDPIVLSHVFESAQLNLIEAIEAIKAIIVMNALTHDYLQDAKGKSISLFTFVQRGGMKKEEVHPFYLEVMDSVLQSTQGVLSQQTWKEFLMFIKDKLIALTNESATPQAQTQPAGSSVDVFSAPAATPTTPVTPLPVSPPIPPVSETPVNQPTAAAPDATTTPTTPTGVSESPTIVGTTNQQG